MKPNPLCFRLALPALTVLVLAGCSVMPAQLMPARAVKLDAAQTTALFSGRTATARRLADDRTSVTYYAPNGRAYQLREGRQREGSWRVTRGGRMCLAMEQRSESCRVVKRGTDGSYRKYREDGSREQAVIQYVGFARGNQLAAAAAGRPVATAAAETIDRSRHAEIQRLLAQAGYNPGPVDGLWGPRSRAALAAFQADRRLPVTGQPDEDARQALRQAVAQASAS